MGLLQRLFGKKESACCQIKIEEVKQESKTSCCAAENEQADQPRGGTGTCCK